MNSKHRKIIVLAIGILLIIILILMGKLLHLHNQTVELKDVYKNSAVELPRTQQAPTPTTITIYTTPTNAPIIEPTSTRKPINRSTKRPITMPTPTIVPTMIQPTPTMVPVKIYIAPTPVNVTKTPFISPHAPTPEPAYMVTYIPGKGWCYEIRTYENGTKKTMPRIERVTLTNIYGVEQLYEITCKLINGKEHCGSSPAMNKKTWNAYKPYHESIQKWTKRPGCNDL